MKTGCGFFKAIAIAAIVACGTGAIRATPASPATQRIAIKDKTLVSWVAVEDLDCRGGSALSIGVNNLWDGLVYSERVPNKWMAGSEVWHRTPPAAEIAKGADARLNQITQIALVQHGIDATLLRDGTVIVSWQLTAAPPVYGKDSYALFGWRHLGCSSKNSSLHASIRDARIYDFALSPAQLSALKPGEMGAPKPVAWWDFAKGDTDQMGVFNCCDLAGNARIDGGQLRLSGTGDYLLCTHGRLGLDRIQFRPKIGVFGDPIPFYWNGQYHVFYLRGGRPNIPWYHIVSDNLVDWREYPHPAISVDGAVDSWDGGDMFTGSVTENGGRFYCFYCGSNGANPKGNQGIRLATSDDLVLWKKQADFVIVPDGKIYNATRIRDFRDAFPYKIEGRNEWWMVLCAQTSDKKQAAGVYTSNDLQQWTPAPPLKADGQECPDLFKIGDTYYLIGGDHYSYSKDLRGKFTAPIQRVIDRPGIYAGKRMFDGKRNIWVGWISDTTSLSDGDKQNWGGTMCSPRELLPGPDGVLYVRPVKEVIDAFNQTAVDLKTASRHFETAQWSSDDGQMTSKSVPARATFDVPAEGMLNMTLKLSNDAKVTIAFRTDESGKQEGYLYTLTPSTSTVVTHGQGINWSREGCRINVDQPVTIRAILIGQSIEFFVNDQYAFTRTAYDLPEGELGIQITKGSVTLQDLSFKQLPPKSAENAQNSAPGISQSILQASAFHESAK